MLAENVSEFVKRELNLNLTVKVEVKS